MTINSLFSANNVATVEVEGLVEYQQRLARIERDLSPRGGLHNQMAKAAGMTHRHLMGLSRPTEMQGRGILPVDTGRLKNSIFWDVRGRGNSLIGRVATNLEYAPYVEERRGFMARTERDMAKPINDLFGAYVRKVANK